MRLTLARAALMKSASEASALPDSAHVRISADDMQAMDFGFAGDSLAFDLEGLPAGDNRLIAADLFRGGRLLYSGRGTFSFKREARTDAAVRCDPQFSRVLSRFHLPVGLPAPIAGGSLKLQGPVGAFTADLVIQDEFGSFSLDELPGNVSYDVSMVLSDSAGKVRYQADRSGVFLPLGEEASWDLSLLPVDAAAGLSLTLGSAAESHIAAAFPARTRKPARAGEIILSEFYAAPADKDSGSNGEWFEVFNRSADTLSLNGCRIARDRSAGVTHGAAFDSLLALPPGAAMTFGRSAAHADVHYQDFSMVNTASSLLLLCAGDSLVEDSLRYSSVAADSATALPMKEGFATGLDAAAVSRRGSPHSWCLEKIGSGGESGPGYTSPGSVGSCGG